MTQRHVSLLSSLRPTQKKHCNSLPFLKPSQQIGRSNLLQSESDWSKWYFIFVGWLCYSIGGFSLTNLGDGQCVKMTNESMSTWKKTLITCKREGKQNVTTWQDNNTEMLVSNQVSVHCWWLLQNSHEVPTWRRTRCIMLTYQPGSSSNNSPLTGLYGD